MVKAAQSANLEYRTCRFHHQLLTPESKSDLNRVLVYGVRLVGEVRIPVEHISEHLTAFPLTWQLCYHTVLQSPMARMVKSCPCLSSKPWRQNEQPEEQLGVNVLLQHDKEGRTSWWFDMVYLFIPIKPQIHPIILLLMMRL